MYYCLCINHSYSYEIYEILSLFYRGEKLTNCESEDAVPSDCMLIKSRLENDGNQINAEALLIKVVDGRYELLSSETVDIIMDGNIKKSQKHAVKLSLFKLLKGITNADVPWGILVGIRPSKIVNDLKTKGFTGNQIESKLKSNYLMRDDKIRLVMDISDNSFDIINHDPKKISLYIGIPFCPSRCVYCSFASYPIVGYREYISGYMDALKREINAISSICLQNFAVDTIYVGGGTPTSLPDDIFEQLMCYISDSFDVKSVREFTVEAGRPDTINEKKLTAMKKHGVGRISINPQTMNACTLKLIGRNHTVQDIIDKYKLARSLGFDNINMDIILGLPGENLDYVKNTVDGIAVLSPENITVHTMAVKRASALKEKLIENEQIPIPEGKNVNAMMEYVQQAMLIKNYLPYYMYRQKMMVGNLENIGYCKPGFECVYNIQMIEEKETIVGIGADAVTKFVFHDENRIERLANKKDIKDYIATIDAMIDKKIDALNQLT